MRILLGLIVSAVFVVAQHVDSSEVELARQLARLDELQKRYTGGHPEVKATIAAIDKLRAGLAAALPDNWWRHAGAVVAVGVTPGQVARMDEVFQQYRLKLIDLNAALEKEEVLLEPLVAADRPDQGKTAAQIDRVANARAELEKARGRMLLGIRMVLEPEQWKKLNSLSAAEKHVLPTLPALPTNRPALSTKQLPTKSPQLPVTKRPE